ncbi:MAG: transposase [candidate division Zixibacteria bacterium]|nr:transposase [candidate division Zixibacteria bacterium]
MTFVTYGSMLYFEDDRYVESCIAFLKDLSLSYNFNVLVYCFMPDHLHLLIEGKEENSNLRKFISMFKQRTNFHFKKKEGNPLWQKDYYEHVLRKNEDTIQVMKYILNNPVRKGMVAEYRDYPFLGSLVYDLKEVFL